ncbi:hypothetical protein [Desertivibrio insolitus]|uniref:hypothetical protein n=1 Tax=Herbiconiux sp. SYSU D00978 TaxID=2812562 RepID=UPI001A9698E7|nr:hypothetical protein [Herbiconiux sp. SYSU D00978]
MATTNRSYDDYVVLDHLLLEHGVQPGEAVVSAIDVDFDSQIPGADPMAQVTVVLKVSMPVEEAEAMLDSRLLGRDRLPSSLQS